MTRLLPLLAGLALSACTLIDQRTFAPSPEAEPIPSAPAAPIRADTRTPLITIDYATPNPNYRDLLRLAVRAAESRNPAVQFDVVGAVQELRSSAPPETLEVMRAIIANGVPAARVHLGISTDSSLSAIQVRVYVR